MIQSIIIRLLHVKVSKRQAKLVEIVRKNEKVSVELLASRLETSRETIRRDLTELGKTGKIQKVHGGAIVPKVFGEGSFQERLSMNVGAKVAIARKAAEFVQPHETLFINTGSTSYYFAEELAQKSNLTIVTNSAENARLVSSPKSGNHTFLLGGEYIAGNRQTLGSMVTAQVAAFRAHHCVLTIGALDCQSGLMEFGHEEAELAAVMADQAEALMVLADRSKFNALASFKVCPLGRITRLICDAMPPGGIADEIMDHGGEIILAD